MDFVPLLYVRNVICTFTLRTKCYRFIFQSREIEKIELDEI